MSVTWPIVEYNSDFEPNFIFLLSPPNAGSTAIAQVFNNSKGVSQLHSRGEGQWLIEGLCSNDRWNKTKFINRESLRSVWISECYKKFKNDGSLYFIEKSPPNMMRIDLLQSIFPNHFLVVNNRDPYANISSMFFRYNQNVNSMPLKERRQKMQQIVKSWLNRSLVLKNIIEDKGAPYLSYEKFCENPELLQKIIDRSPFRGSVTLNFKEKVRVKDYKAQTIVNLNDKQIGRLTNDDIQVITSCLKTNKNLVEYFGYHILDQTE